MQDRIAVPNTGDFCLTPNDRTKFFGIAVIVLLLSTVRLAALDGLPARQQTHSMTSLATPVREADGVCASCHKKIYDEYLQTPMANASGLATEGFTPGEFTHPPSGVHYRVELRDGQVWLKYDRAGSPEFALHGEERLDYFIGSGLRGRTYP